MKARNAVYAIPPFSAVLFNNMLGSILSVKDGSKMTQVAMTSFGETSNNDAFFTGKPMIGELGYAFLFRSYRSDLGKWQTADPMGYPDGFNNLAYCNNRVIDFIDLFGTEEAPAGSKTNPLTFGLSLFEKTLELTPESGKGWAKHTTGIATINMIYLTWYRILSYTTTVTHTSNTRETVTHTSSGTATWNSNYDDYTINYNNEACGGYEARSTADKVAYVETSYCLTGTAYNVSTGETIYFTTATYKSKTTAQE